MARPRPRLLHQERQAAHGGQRPPSLPQHRQGGRHRRELRHTFVSILSDNDVPIEKITDLVGHRTTIVTQTVYRHQLRPVIETGATAMNTIFEPPEEQRVHLTSDSPWARPFGSPRRDIHSKIVGRTGFEPVTSSVSGKRSPAELTALSASPRCYQSRNPSARRQGHRAPATGHVAASRHSFRPYESPRAGPRPIALPRPTAGPSRLRRVSAASRTAPCCCCRRTA